MPFINTVTNVKISAEKETLLKERLGKAIEAFPGKTEQWLMLSFEDNCRMYFRGSNEKPMAFLEVKLLGEVSSEASSKCTALICDIIKDVLDIDGDMVYVKYEGTKNWGYNGSNF